MQGTESRLNSLCKFSLLHKSLRNLFTNLRLESFLIAKATIKENAENRITTESAPQIQSTSQIASQFVREPAVRILR